MHSVLVRLLAASSSTNINLQPGQAGNLPGDTTLTTLASGVGHWALLASIVGVIVGGVMWGFIQQTFRTLSWAPRRAWTVPRLQTATFGTRPRTGRLNPWLLRCERSDATPFGVPFCKNDLLMSGEVRAPKGTEAR